MNQHRVDEQLNGYQKIIEDFRNMMKNNLNSVNANFGQLNQENIALKAENERLLYELGKVQENAFLATHAERTKKAEKDSQISQLTEKLTEFQENLEKSHLNGTVDKSVQCIHTNDGECNVDAEFNHVSIEIYKLINNLKEKTFEIVNEYGFKSLNNSPRKGMANGNRKLYKDTDDVDASSMIINCKKRFCETKEILE